MNRTNIDLDNKIRLIKTLREQYLLCDLYNQQVYVQSYRVASGYMVRIISGISELAELYGGYFDNNEMHLLETGISGILSAQVSEDYLVVADYLEGIIKPLLCNVFLACIVDDDAIKEKNINDNYTYNLNRLKGKDISLYQEIQSSTAVVTDQIEFSKSGFYTFYLEGEKGKYYLCSNTNPRFEGSVFAQRYYNPACEKYYIFGLGLGYHCEALTRQDSGALFQIFEDDIRIIKAAMLVAKLDWLWDNDNVQLLYDPELRKFAKCMEKAGRLSYDTKEVLIIHHPSIKHIKNPGIREYMERLFISDSGIRSQGQLMAANFRENIKHCRHDIDSLKSDFEDMDAIIVAAGPSLDKNIECLKKSKHKQIIIAVGTVFRKLISKGIRPDFVIIADAQENVERQFDGLFECDIKVLILSTAYMGIAKKYKGEKFILYQEDYKEAERLAGEEGQILFASGGSVSTTALDVCIRMGCSSITFVGLDLAYTEGRSHADNTDLYQRVNIDGWLSEKGYEWVVDKGKWEVIYNKVYVSRTFNIYRRWIEDRIREKDVTIPIYDATEGGVVINGIEIKMLRDIVGR